MTNPDNTFIQYGYDSNGNKTEMTIPWGTTQYSFDQLNRMKTVTSPDNEVTEYFYNDVGNRDSINHANGTSVGYDYDNLNRLTNVTNYAPDASVISSFTYELNNAGIRTAVNEADGARVEYGYDDLYRLTGETRTGSNAYSITYSYDNVGNRLTKDHDGVVTTYAYNNRDQVTSETNASETITYTYDGSGRTETKSDNSGLTTYGWADNDRMVSVALPSGTVMYEYDAEGNKVAVDDGAEAKMYLVDMLQSYAQVIAEYDNTSNPLAEYVYGLERISQNRSGSVSVFLADGQGSIRELTNSTGAITDTYSYLAFGEELSRTGTTENNFKFVGEEIDPNSGFSYNRARWYNMSNGRFVSVDPFAGKRTSPLSLHRYLYSNGSPASFVDPSGEFSLIQVMTAVTVSTILANVAITTWSTATIADAGFKIDAFIASGRADISYNGGTGGGGVDVVYDKKSGKLWASIALEGGLDPLSVFKKHRGGGFTIVGGAVFNMSNPSQLAGVGVGAFWPMSVLRLMPIIGGRSNVWGAMTQFAKKAINHQGWTIGFGRSTGGPATFLFGKSSRMFSAMGSYNTEFLPQDEWEPAIRNAISAVSSAAQSLSGMGDNAFDFAENADAACNTLQ